MKRKNVVRVICNKNPRQSSVRVGLCYDFELKYRPTNDERRSPISTASVRDGEACSADKYRPESARERPYAAADQRDYSRITNNKIASKGTAPKRRAI